ncbi:MAG: hypothetical protein LC640_07535 [Frankia sp.]|nr:hypothetical protein [Frankia sp.]
MRFAASPGVLGITAALAVAAGAVLLRPAPPATVPGPLARPAPGVALSPARTPTPSPAPSLMPSPMRPDLRALVGALDRARVAGYRDPAHADPRRWLSSECPCLAAERATLARLAGLGHRLRAQPPVVVAIDVLTATADVGRVRVVDRLPAYTEIDRHDRVVHRWPGRGPRTWLVLLRRTAAGWRVADLRAG